MIPRTFNQFILACIAFIAVTCSAVSCNSADRPTDKHDATIEIDGFVYRYETLPNHSHLDRDYVGKITVTYKGDDVYQEIDGLYPGCDFQTISTVSTQTNGRKKQLIVFCGSYGGGSQTIKVLHHGAPHTPAFLNFGKALPNLADLNNDGQFEAKVYIREYDQKSKSTFNYLVVYKLLDSNGQFVFVPYFGQDIASVYMQYYRDITNDNLPNNISAIEPAIAALLATHDKQVICTEVSKLLNKYTSLDHIIAATRKAVLHGYPDFNITVCKEAFK